MKKLDLSLSYLVENLKTSSQETKVILISSDSMVQKVEEALLKHCPRLQESGQLLSISGYCQAGVFRFESSKKIIAKRLRASYQMAQQKPQVILCSALAFARSFPSPSWVVSKQITLSTQQEIEKEKILEILENMGYLQTKIVEEIGEYCIRGSLLDLWTPNEKTPTRIELFGESIERIRSFRSFDQRSFQTLDEVHLLPAREFVWPSSSKEMTAAIEQFNHGILLQGVTGDTRVRLLEDLEAKIPFAGIDDVAYLFSTHQFPSLQEYLSQQPDTTIHLIEEPEDILKSFEKIDQLYDNAKQVSSFKNQLSGKKEILFPLFSNTKKFADKQYSLSEKALQPEQQIHLSKNMDYFDNYTETDLKEAQKSNLDILMSAQFSEFSEGDLVVHVQYGIAKFKGLISVEVAGIKGDFLTLEYAHQDKIYVPINKLNLVQKYIGSSNETSLDSLKGSSWEKRKEKAKKDIEKIAKELIEHQAKRAMTLGHSFSKIDDDYLLFEEAFPYEPTADQIKAIKEIMADMGHPKSMDRLLCGDVGFGKTEVAMRAAYRAVLDSKQVAWLVPTTVLAHQHFRTLKERFKDFGVQIALLDRSVSSSKSLEQLKQGRIDIVIGTHRLLSKDIQFKDLGLLIVDEEQRFGVLQKEKIKTMSYGIDVLTMTATPIPRTLQMAMTGLRDLSLLTTPPKARLATKTFVCPFEDDIIRQAILDEINRGGQIFYLHNRVEELQSVMIYLQNLIPHARICLGHGKMNQKDLESTMIAFIEGRFDILLCTTIIESGIDMPNVNTILVQNANHFGLAQLYQLRGRVGRRSTRGYAYFLTTKDLSKDDEGLKRLEILKEHQDLGSGFIIASHDMEMRGSGHILGDDQSGQVTDIGLETYLQMLNDAIKNLNGQKQEPKAEVEIQIPVECTIPSSYIENQRDRMKMYRRFFATRQEATLNELILECEDRFGPLPNEAKNLGLLAQTRRLLLALGALSLTVTDDFTEVKLDPKHLQPQAGDELGEELIKRILDVCNFKVKHMRITPEGKLLFPLRKKDFLHKLQQAWDELLRVLKLLVGDSYQG